MEHHKLDLTVAKLDVQHMEMFMANVKWNKQNINSS